MSVAELTGCVSAHWSPEIGDPNVTGWLTVASYLICCVLAFSVWRRGTDRGFWGLITLLMLALAINKQLDLQTALTVTGKCLAKAQGWYAERRIVQEIFIVGVLVTVLIGLVIGAIALRNRLRRNGLALVGLAILSGFVVIRAVSFHHVDQLIGMRQFGISTNFILENAGLVLIAINALTILRRGRPRAALPG